MIFYLNFTKTRFNFFGACLFWRFFQIGFGAKNFYPVDKNKNEGGADEYDKICGI